jgi:cyclic pyranopterin phosphate synthase
MTQSGVTPLPVPRVRRTRGRPGSTAGTFGDGSPALVDGYGRVHDDLRISVTDRCNLRCVYCMEEDTTFLPHQALLTFEEIIRIASVAGRMGVRTVRFTGGEPLQRRGIVELVGRVSSVGFSDVAMTTNGVGLARLAGDLKRAGLQRVNVSCDSLREGRYSQIRRRGHLDRVLEAIDAAEAAGLAPVKVNVVLIAGVNDDEIEDFAAFARETKRTVRFIEFMPLDAGASWSRERLVPTDVVLERITAKWPLQPIDSVDNAPAERYRFMDGEGEIGVVPSVTRPFCGTCNRLRLTADGAIRNCLFSDDEVSVRDLIRRGGGDADIARLLHFAVGIKLAGHGINEPGFLRPRRSMSMIGG